MIPIATKIIPVSVPQLSNKIPKSLKHNVWLIHIGTKFEGKCSVKWCKNIITPFDFEAGHNVPFSKGGETTINNLKPICSCCNKSMGNRYTIDEYSNTFKSTKISWFNRIFKIFK